MLKRSGRAFLPPRHLDLFDLKPTWHLAPGTSPAWQDDTCKYIQPRTPGPYGQPLLPLALSLEIGKGGATTPQLCCSMLSAWVLWLLRDSSWWADKSRPREESLRILFCHQHTGIGGLRVKRRGGTMAAMQDAFSDAMSAVEEGQDVEKSIQDALACPCLGEGCEGWGPVPHRRAGSLPSPRRRRQTRRLWTPAAPAGHARLAVAESEGWRQQRTSSQRSLAPLRAQMTSRTAPAAPSLWRLSSALSAASTRTRAWTASTSSKTSRSAPRAGAQA